MPNFEVLHNSPTPAEAVRGGRLVENLREKKEPSLGELNPLLFPPDLGNPEVTEALQIVIARRIGRTHGLQPASVESTMVYDPSSSSLYRRMMVKFETSLLTEAQIKLLEDLTRDTYGESVRTRKSIGGGVIAPGYYPKTEQERVKKSKMNEDKQLLGWYMGAHISPLTPVHNGLYVFRDFGEATIADYLKNYNYKEWFFNDELVSPMKKDKTFQTKYRVEIREGGLGSPMDPPGLYQTDLVELAVQVASILGKGELIEDPKLKYQIYNDLNRLGLRKTDREDIYGLDEQIDRIERVLILPLANIEAANSIDLTPSSVLLVGVPGTGKTHVIESMLQQDNGVFILPVDPKTLAAELAARPADKKILPRISKVFKQTGVPVVLHLDDVENIAEKEDSINSSLLNLMAGVRESGFFVIASTNYPERLSPQLLQPQRFGNVIYFGLHSTEARSSMLRRHALRESRNLGRPLFPSDENREAIVRALAELTDGYTPRYLADIPKEARSFLLARLARIREVGFGLTEEDIDDTTTVEDWERAFAEVDRKYDKQAVKKRDDELREFSERHYKSKAGFQISNANETNPNRLLRDKVHQIAATLGQSQEPSE